MALAATAVIMNGNANRRNWPEPNCGKNLRLNWECSFRLAGPLRLMENDVQLLSKDPS